MWPSFHNSLSKIQERIIALSLNRYRRDKQICYGTFYLSDEVVNNSVAGILRTNGCHGDLHLRRPFLLAEGKGIYTNNFLIYCMRGSIDKADII